MAALFGGALALGAATAAAQPMPARPSGTPPESDEAPLPVLAVVRSQGATDCPDSAALAEAVAKQVGRMPALDPDGLAAAAGFDVEIRKGRTGYEATIRPRAQPTALRRLSDPGSTCDGIADAIALTLAIFLDREVAPPPAARTAEGPGHGPRPPPPRAVGPDARLEAPPPWPRRRGFGLDVHASALATVSVLDGVGLAVGGEVAVPLPIGIRLGGGVLGVPTQSYDAPPGRIELSLVAATLRLGTTVLRRPLGDGAVELTASAIAAAGVLRAAGVGFTEDEPPKTDPWVAVGPGLGAEGSIVGPLGWSIRTDTLILLRHQRYAVAQRSDGVVRVGADRGAVPEPYDTPPVGFVVGGGLRVTIF